MFSIIYVEGLCEICKRPNNETSENKASRKTQDLLFFFPCLFTTQTILLIIFIFYLPLLNSATKQSRKNMNWGHFPPPFPPTHPTYAFYIICFNTEENCAFPTEWICVLPCFSPKAAIIFLYIALPGFVAGCFRNLNRVSKNLFSCTVFLKRF